ncbi:hypothetical protein GCM10023094_28870 [Rhodococcus olei]|uniref:Uncharacterized protein n=2 Tax=Rhodococcus olei TaxID=2161675 RepID=A0ABP8P5T9_9NOCA
MPSARPVDPSFRWDALVAWILDWEVADEVDDTVLERWSDGLAAAASRIDPHVLWSPLTDTVVAPTGYTETRITAVLRQCIARYAGSTTEQVLADPRADTDTDAFPSSPPA